MGTYKVSIPARDRISALIREGVRPTGVFATLFDPAVTDILGSVGFHFVIVDSEHTPMEPKDALGHVRAATSRGMLSFARLPDSLPTTIRRFMDVGVDGIILPHMETAEQMAAAVSVSRFSPEGSRGSGPGSYMAGYSSVPEWEDIKAWATRNTMMIPQIESRRGLQNVEEICAVDGVGAVIFGPGDLAQDLGLSLMEMNSPTIREAWERTKAAAAANGLWTMTPWVHGGKQTPNAGADIVFHHYDVYFMRESAQSAFDACMAETREKDM
ncbi:HpcH/HpaI aldolase family protein [Geodermatophilus sp. URMC 64]